MLNLNEINAEALGHAASAIDAYEFHEHLLERGQVTGDRAMAISSARMLLFHLRQLFHTLTPRQQELVRSKLALSS
jgi:hypothetical protein